MFSLCCRMLYFTIQGYPTRLKVQPVLTNICSSLNWRHTRRCIEPQSVSRIWSVWGQQNMNRQTGISQHLAKLNMFSVTWTLPPTTRSPTWTFASPFLIEILCLKSSLTYISRRSHSDIKTYSNPFTGPYRSLGLQKSEAPRISRQSAYADVTDVSPKHRPLLPSQRYDHTNRCQQVCKTQSCLCSELSNKPQRSVGDRRYGCMHIWCRK
jgi:hypothetical protein